MTPVRSLEALFRVALRAYPASWRRRYGAEARASFREGVAARWRCGRLGTVSYALRAVLDAVRVGLAERRAEARRGLGASWRATLADGLLADLRHAARRAGRAPGFTLAVVAILALGVGANTTVYTVLRSVVLRPPPFPEPERLVLPRRVVTAPGAADSAFSLWSYPKFREYRTAAAGQYDGLGAYAVRFATVTDPGDAASTPFEVVAGDYFDVLGIRPAAGRFFATDELTAAAPPAVAVLSHAFAGQRFGGADQALGQSITADGHRLSVIGVAPVGFTGLTGNAAYWLPISQAPLAVGSFTTEQRNAHWMNAIARLPDGASPDVLSERAQPILEASEAVDPTLVAPERIGLQVVPLEDAWSSRDARSALWLAMVAALLVLAIAVANLAALLVARGKREVRETAVRLAMGAGKGRLVRERLAESVLLSALGGGLGLALASASIGVIGRALPAGFLSGGAGDLRRTAETALSMDATAAGFACVAAVVSAVIFGALPALGQNALRLVPALRSGAGEVSRRDRRAWLVAGQLALSIVLLVGAGLVTTTLRRLHDQQGGFDHEGLLVFRYTLPARRAAYQDEAAVRAFHRELRERAAALPGVASAAIGTSPPLLGHLVTTNVSRVIGGEEFPEGRRPRIGVAVVDGAYFSTLGTEMLAGRPFSDAEFTSAEPVAIVNRTAAETLFPGEDAVGREFDMGIAFDDTGRAFRVVGVVEDVLYSDPTEGMMPEAFLPLGLWGTSSTSLFLRVDGPTASVVPAARDVLESLDPNVPFSRVWTGSDLRRSRVADTRALVGVLIAFAALALLLSCAGLWAVVAHAIAERQREIGLRVAIGARAAQVERHFVGRGLAPILGGALAGLALAAAGAPLAERLLFGVGPRDVWVYAGAAALLSGVALLATWLPARRAARIDPVRALSA